MIVVVIGSNGLVGQSIAKKLTNVAGIETIPITRKNISQYRDFQCDVLINANGSSRKGWCSQNPSQSFALNCTSIYQYMDHFIPNRYILISSVDVYEEKSDLAFNSEETLINYSRLCTYGFHKYIAEQIVSQTYENHLILRPSNIIGTGMKKGPFFDLINTRGFYINPFSRIDFIDADYIADFIYAYISSCDMKIVNLCSSESVTLVDLAQSLDISYCPENMEKSLSLPLLSYNISVNNLSSIFCVKSSLDHARKYIYNNL